MGIRKQEIDFRLSEPVSSSVQVFQRYTPPANSTVEITNIIAEGTYTINSEIRVVWDYGSENEEILWTMKGSSNFNNLITIDSTKTDGNKSLALVLDNGEADRLNMSAFMTILVGESNE